MTGVAEKLEKTLAAAKAESVTSIINTLTS